MPDTGLGLTYPASTAHTRLWEHFQTLAETADEAISAHSVIVCTSSTRPSSPTEGMVIYETDTDLLRLYTGSVWRSPAGLNGAARVKVYPSANQNLITSTVTLLSFDSEAHKNVTSMHSTSSQTSRLIAPYSGLFDVRVQVSFATNTTGRRAITIRKNAGGSAVGGTQVNVVSMSAANSDTTTYGCSFDIELNAADYLEVFPFQSSGGLLAVLLGADFTWASMREAA